MRLYPSKIHSIEIHPLNSNLMVTSGGDKLVSVWDIRNMHPDNPLKTLQHEKNVNLATFNRRGDLLLTTDQGNELRVYATTNWNLNLTVKHPHRHFQYVPPFRGFWLPLVDAFVIGRYPEKIGPRCIDIIDATSGRLLRSLSAPDGFLCPVSKFNNRGDMMISLQASSFTLWKPRSLIRGSHQSASRGTVLDDLTPVLDPDQAGQSGIGRRNDFGYGVGPRKLDSDEDDSDDDDDNDDDENRPQVVRLSSKSRHRSKHSKSGKSRSSRKSDEKKKRSS